MSSLKEQKELFVSNLLGGTILEIYNVTAVSLSAYLSYNLISAYSGYNITFPVDFVLNCMTILLSITLYSNSTNTLHFLILAPGILAAISGSWGQKDRKKSKSKIPRDANGARKQLLVKKPFITAYRSHMLVITNFAILAVDFKMFPRRFAKVETWGTSLMDLGVGSFVFSMGLATSRAIIKQRFDSSKSTDYRFKLSQYGSLIMKNTIKSLPVLALGLIRLVSVKALEYQEHVTEYGIHWNFFITLGLLPIFFAIIDPILNFVPRFIVALVICIGYELIMVNTELMAFILRSDNRMDTLVTMNKEGIFSFIGYFSIFIFGQSFGSFVLTGFKTPNNLFSMCSYQRYKKAGAKPGIFTVTTTQGLVIATFFTHALFWYVQEAYFVSSISRRLANLPYVLWVVSYNSLFLLGYNVIESVIAKPGASESKILDAFNNNGLLSFLLGNLFTGLINMTINTLSCNAPVTFAILVTYGLILSTIAVLLDRYHIYIKL
ncbi:GPI-anchored wall transfer protein 1 [Debaryomyces fabryi]|uniref:GPI-anchored wall transfer protein n=1 Tax=Debaryomyces fabryi TaxID=58627 RepID=A0A0V1Q417_9ASCO|nr:GPI-anchored wall transfer protein 1 [Debaryomyces fabryi]KSA03245.1 GPI-anchored wall transfer protein 1 [Debaryomyces fabryi]CUM55263.1 unnamed protein product [Debaryomyces fabryi]